MSLRTEWAFYSGCTMPIENIIMQNITMRILSQHQPCATTEGSFNTPTCPHVLHLSSMLLALSMYRL